MRIGWRRDWKRLVVGVRGGIAGRGGISFCAHQFLCSSGDSRVMSSKSVSSLAGSLITYFSLDLCESWKSLQRSLQNENSGFASESVGFLKMGQRNFMRLKIPQSALRCAWV